MGKGQKQAEDEQTRKCKCVPSQLVIRKMENDKKHWHQKDQVGKVEKAGVTVGSQDGEKEPSLRTGTRAGMKNPQGS